MKKICLFLLVIMIIFTFSACGESDPNCGVYECTKVTVMEVEMDVTDVYPKGASIELQSGSKGTITLDGTEYPLKWSLEENKITLTIDDVNSVGTLENGAITVDLMDAGMTYTFVQKAADSSGK